MGINDYEIKDVKVTETYADYTRNWRASYDDLKPIVNFNPEKHKPGLYEDIAEYGVNTPLYLSKLTPERAAKIAKDHGLPNPPKYLVIRGHRRFRVISMIREKYPDRFSMIPAQVYTGLTESDEARLMADHMQTKTLNEFEQYQAVRDLALKFNISEEEIGFRLAQSRTWVQRRKWIAKMPKRVEEEYRKRYTKDDKGEPLPHVRFIDKDLIALYAALNRDINAGRNPESPGAEWLRAWEELVNKGRVQEPEPPALTRHQILDKVLMVRDDLVKEAMLWAAGTPNNNIKDVDDRIQNLRANLQKMDDAFQDASAKLKVAESEVATLKETIAAKDAEINNLKIEVATLQGELKAKPGKKSVSV